MCKIKNLHDNKLQWHRHRVFSYNEMSGRYSILPDQCLENKPHQWRSQSKTNKQGSDNLITKWPEDWTVDEENNIKDKNGEVFAKGKWTPGELLSSLEEDIQNESRWVYEKMLELGVAKEQARNNLPVSQYSEMYVTGNLHNWFHFCSLRSDSHAQLEIRLFSDIILGFIKELFPLCFEAWYDYRYGASGLSRLDRKLFSQLVRKYSFSSVDELREKFEATGDQSPITLMGMTKRELAAFWGKLKEPEERDFSLDFSKCEPFDNFKLE